MHEEATGGWIIIDLAIPKMSISRNSRWCWQLWNLRVFCGKAFSIFQCKHNRRSCGVARGKFFFFFLQAYVCLLFGIHSKWQENSLNSVSVSGWRTWPLFCSLDSTLTEQSINCETTFWKKYFILDNLELVMRRHMVWRYFNFESYMSTFMLILQIKNKSNSWNFSKFSELQSLDFFWNPEWAFYRKSVTVKDFI